MSSWGPETWRDCGDGDCSKCPCPKKEYCTPYCNCFTSFVDFEDQARELYKTIGRPKEEYGCKKKIY